MENTKNIELKWVFNKWFVYDDNNINTSQEFWRVSINTRNWIWTIKNRKGYSLLQEVWVVSWKKINSLTAHDSKILVEYDWDLYVSNEDLDLYENKWVINTWLWTTPYWNTTKTIGDIAIIANWWDMQYYDKKDWLLKTITNPYNDIWEVWETEQDDIVWDKLWKWTWIASNDEASVIIAVENDWYIYKSLNFWETFTQKWSIAWYVAVAMSSDWLHVYALAYQEKSNPSSASQSWLYYSSNGWETFTKILTNNNTFWNWVACSTDWSKLYIVWHSGDTSIWKVYSSSDYGATFTERLTWKDFVWVWTNSDWSKVIVWVKWWKLQLSTDSWATFVEKWESKSYTAVFMNRDWVIFFSESKNLYRSDNDLIGSTIVLSSDLYNNEWKDFISIQGSTKEWIYLAACYNWKVFASFDKWVTWDVLDTLVDNYTCVFANENCDETDWVLLTTSFNWYIKRSRNTIKFNPSIMEIYKKRLYIAWMSNRKSTLVVSQWFVVDERELIDFWPNKVRKPIVSVREWDIIWLKASQTNMYLFDTTWISILTWFSNDWITPSFQYLDKNTVPVSNKTIVAADDLVFVLTNDKKIKTIWYTPGVTNPTVAELSNIQWQSIQLYLNEVLDDNQDNAFWYFYDPDKTVKFHVRSKWSWSNDLVIVYDMVNKTFHIDTNKKFSNYCRIWGKYYVWSDINWKIFEDEVGWNDNWVAITSTRELKLFDFWDSTISKIMRELRLSWMIDLNTTIHMKLYADDNLIFDELITRSLIDNQFTWSKTENKLYQFRKEMSKGDIYARWYTFKIVFEAVWNTDTIWFVLNSLFTRVWGVWLNWKNELFER